MSRHDSNLAWEVDIYLWSRYDPNGEFTYPSISQWDDLLRCTIESENYDKLNKEEVLSILFGLHHRTRTVDGLWTSMFEQGVMQCLLAKLYDIEEG